jgi:hypothetical protein
MPAGACFAKWLDMKNITLLSGARIALHNRKISLQMVEFNVFPGLNLLLWKNFILLYFMVLILEMELYFTQHMRFDSEVLHQLSPVKVLHCS